MDSTPNVDQTTLNLIFMRDVVIPHMRDNLHLVSFDSYTGHRPSCGTTHCLGGWYLHLKYGREWPDDFPVTTLIRDLGFERADPRVGALFGSAHHRDVSTDLRHRATLIDAILKERSA